MLVPHFGESVMEPVWMADDCRDSPGIKVIFEVQGVFLAQWADI